MSCMRTARLGAAAATVLSLLGLTLEGVSSSAAALVMDKDKPKVDASNPFVEVTANHQSRPSTSNDTGAADASSSIWETRLVESSCGSSNQGMACVSYECADPNELGYIIERRRRGTNGSWAPIGRACDPPAGPVLTPGRVLEAVRRIGLPSMSVEVPTETLVNYDTVVYTRAETFSRTVDLLGFTVDVEATPSEFIWSYGDGTTETTATAGHPYPATDITHTWNDAHRTFHPSVDVTYQIRFRVDDGDWQTLTDTITVSGPASDVRIREATGMLTEMS